MRYNLNSKNEKTLKKVFQNPILSNILWKDIERLFEALGCTIKEKGGSGIEVRRDEKYATFHRPHPQKETDKGAVKSVRIFLLNLGVMENEM